MSPTGMKVSNSRLNSIFLSVAVFWSVLVVSLARWGYWEFYTPLLAAGSFTCAWHDAQAELLAEEGSPEVIKRPLLPDGRVTPTGQGHYWKRGAWRKHEAESMKVENPPLATVNTQLTGRFRHTRDQTRMNRQCLLMHGKLWTRGDRWRRWGAETALWRKGTRKHKRRGVQKEMYPVPGIRHP